MTGRQITRLTPYIDPIAVSYKQNDPT